MVNNMDDFMLTDSTEIKEVKRTGDYKGSIPRLSNAEWNKVKELWESTPLNGFQWVVNDLQLPLSATAVRKRANKEKWEKRTSLKKIGENANIKADLVLAKNQKGTADTNNNFNAELAENTRADIIAIHRQEWAELRKQHQIGGENETAKRCLKLDADILKIRQEMERKAWGLDFENLETPVAPPTIQIFGV